MNTNSNCLFPSSVLETHSPSLALSAAAGKALGVPMRIELSQGQFGLIDESDYKAIKSMGKWYARKFSGKWYAINVKMANGKHVNTFMHRFLLGLVPHDGKEVDHKDGDGLNNQRSNLRLATSQQNKFNRHKQVSREGRPCSSKFRGVCLWDTPKTHTKPWQANLTINRKRILSKRFRTEIEAAAAYNAKAIEIFGEFAKLNDLTKSNQPPATNKE